MSNIPFSCEAEQSVIGAILIKDSAFDEIGSLKPEHFYVAANREVFRVMVQMSVSGKRIDVITLAEAVQDAGLDDVTGGLAYIGEIAANVPSAANIKRYAEIVQNKFTERELLGAIGDIQAIVESVGTTREKLNKAQALIMAIAESRQHKQPRIVGDALNDYVAQLDRRSKGVVRGIKTGFTDLDRMLSGGMQEGNLIIVAGRPSMGKSAFTNTIAINAAMDGHPAAIMSMEMTETEQIDRVVATLGRVRLQDVLDANLDEDGCGDRIFSAVAKLRDLPLIIDDEAGLSAHEVMTKARQAKRKYGLKLLIVDALGLMDYDSNKAVSELGQITKTLKGFAKEMSIPVILLCQLSRKCEDRTDKRPVMSDLRDSGTIEQDADLVMMLYRDEYYRPGTPDKGIAELLIRKNRQGKVGTVPLTFIADQTRFESFSGEWNQQTANDRPMTRKRTRLEG